MNRNARAYFKIAIRSGQGSGQGLLCFYSGASELPRAHRPQPRAKRDFEKSFTSLDLARSSSARVGEKEIVTV